MKRQDQPATNVYGAELSRRGFLKTGGALIVEFGFLKGGLAEAAGVDALPPESWVEIREDNTVLIRTGRCDFGQSSIYTAYRQIVADELDVEFEAITTVFGGDTDLTPDGSGVFDLLGRGVINLRKASAYTREAILELASERFAVPRDELSVRAGIVSAGGEQLTYGEIVRGQQLKLTIPVTGDLTSMFGLVVSGDPPLKPASSYRVVGKSFKNSIIPAKVTAKETWVTDGKLPGMLHARMVHPATLGSRLISAGQLDKERFPNSQVVVKGDLVGVVAPTEWEAIQAARQVGSSAQWSEWKGLPGKANLFRYFREDADWESATVSRGRTSKGDVPSAMATANKTLSVSIEMPFMKHAPIGPTVAVADVRADGKVTVHTHTQNAQALRGQLAQMLGISVDFVTVRTSYSGSGHYGRSNGGNAGAEDEAVILSKELGRPVRVQWMREEDLKWSTQSPAGYSDVKIGLTEDGRIAAYQADHYMPAIQDDRPIGAVLAGLPTMPAPSDKGPRLNSTVNGNSDAWLYDEVPNLEELAHGTWQVGQRESPLAIGLRDHTMRTPGQYQQNFPREVAINEAAALAGADAIQFRIDHTKDERVKSLLQRLREESGWEIRPVAANALAPEATRARGQGAALMLRKDGYWACACQIEVNTTTGAIVVEKVTMAADPGIVVNPLQLKRQVEGGVLMGVSHALHEELDFDESRITSRDWLSYPILTMAEVPEVKVVLVHRPETGIYGQGSEGANATVPPAIAAALFDATGRPVRSLPLRPAYVKEMLLQASLVRD